MSNTTPTPHGAGVIHDLAYRRYEGARRAPGWRVLVIARYALITQWRQRGVRLSLLAALLFAVIAAAAGGVKWGFTCTASGACSCTSARMAGRFWPFAAPRREVIGLQILPEPWSQAL